MDRESGHSFLANLGKTRLRPGGKEATDWLMEQASINRETKVLEVACNRGTTMIMLGKKYQCSVVGIDQDKLVIEQAQKNIQQQGLANLLSVQVGNALKLPFPDETFDVVINEAMLTMMASPAKEKALKEYHRVLKSAGILLTHDVVLSKENESLIEKLSKTINVHVQPLTRENWENLFLSNGYTNLKVKNGPMSLMSPRGLIRDEGFWKAVKIGKNGLKRANRPTFMKMFQLFKKNASELGYIAICSKKEEAENES